MINVASIKLFRPIVLMQEPKSLFNLLIIGPKNVNTCTFKYYPKVKPMLVDIQGLFVNKMNEVWNNLQTNLHNISLNIFDTKI